MPKKILNERLRKASELFADRSCPEAKRELAEIIKAAPSCAEAHLLLGNILQFEDASDLEPAIAEYRKVVDLAPEWAEGHHALGSALQQRGLVDEGIPEFRRAMRLAPEDPRPRISLGCCLMANGRYKEAARMLREGIELKPHYGMASARLFLAEAYERLGRIKEAAEQWAIVSKMQSMYPSYGAPINEARAKLREYRVSRCPRKRR